MARSDISSVLQYIRGLEAAEALGALPDQELLKRFVQGHEEAAFAGLMQRHGPMVLGVCRRLLRQPQDAEDAFQATFLLLARGANDIRNPNAVGGWLHGVARRVAGKLRSQTTRRSSAVKPESSPARDPYAVEQAASNPLEQATWKELRAVLDEELARLPGELRLPLVLCYLEGRTQDEGARQVGWSRRAFRRRLEKGRARLARRLARRGITLSSALFALLLSQEAPAMTAALWVPVLQAVQTVAAGQVSGGISATAWGLVEGLVPTLASSKSKLLVVVLLAANLAATGLGIFVAGRGAQRQPPSPELPPAPAASLPAPPEAAPPGVELLGTQAVLRGRIQDASGSAVPHARVAVLVRRPYQPGEHGLRQDVLREGEADADGRFRFVIPADFPTWYPERRIVVAASAAGHAPGSLSVPLRPGQPNLTLSLSANRPLCGRVVDPLGNPAVGVRLEVVRIGSALREIIQTGDGGGNEKNPAALVDVWPPAATTNAAGEFTMPGLGAARNVWLQIHDDRFALETFPAELSDGQPIDDTPYSIMVMPGQVLQGCVSAADTGKPIPFARLTAVSPNEWTAAPRHALHTTAREAPRSARGLPTSLYWTPWLHTVVQEAAPRAPCEEIDARADAAGRFRLRLPAGRFFRLEAHAPPGTPYLALSRVIDRQEENNRQRLSFALPRGVLVTARVHDAADGQPVAGAVAYYVPDRDNQRAGGEVLYGCDVHAISGADGRLRLALPPGRGRLCVHANNGAYVSLPYPLEGEAAGASSHANAIRSLDLPSEAATAEVDVPLRKGVSVTGRVVGPQGQAVASAFLMSARHVHPLNPNTARPLQAVGGHFVLPGCEEGRTYQVLFLDGERRLGAVADLTADPREPPAVVRLQLCGQATARLLDAQGRPLANQLLTPFVLLEPDIPAGDRAARARRAAEAVPHETAWAHPQAYSHGLGPHTEADGRITLTGLVPGVRYGVTQWDGVRLRRITEFFTVRPGETLRLPDVVVPPS